MAGPGDETAAWAGTHSHLRASHADRDRVLDMLKAAFAQGMLGKQEFDLRAGQVLASRTYGDLAALTADIPAGLASARLPERAPQPDSRMASMLFAGVTAAFPSVMFTEALVQSQGVTAATVLAAVLFASLVAAPAAGLLMMVLLRLEKRASRMARPGPLAGPAGQARRAAMTQAAGRRADNGGVIDVGPERFEEMVAAALDSLPEDLGRLMRNVAVTVEHDPGPPGLLGLYEGVPLTSRTTQYAGVLPDRITIYRQAVCAICRTEDEVVGEVRRTVIHEVAHHFGIGDERLTELGW